MQKMQKFVKQCWHGVPDTLQGYIKQYWWAVALLAIYLFVIGYCTISYDVTKNASEIRDLILGYLALPAILLAVWRSSIAAKQAKAANTQAENAAQHAKASNKQAENAATQAKAANTQANIANDNHLLETYTKATEQLNDENEYLILAGIYSLEDIARNNQKYHVRAIKLLAAYIRDKSPRQEKDADNKPINAVIQAALDVIKNRNLVFDRNRKFDNGLAIDLSGTNLKGANLKGANLEGANLEGAYLEKADLVASLKGANLSGADLYNANLYDAFLRNANLEGANLSYTILKGANLEHANLREANLSGADLYNAKLQRAELAEANLLNAILEGANLESTYFTNCTTLHQSILLNTAINLDKAILSDEQRAWCIEQGYIEDSTA